MMMKILSGSYEILIMVLALLYRIEYSTLFYRVVCQLTSTTLTLTPAYPLIIVNLKTHMHELLKILEFGGKPKLQKITTLDNILD